MSKFYRALLDTNDPGAFASALGSVIGGLVGAIAAVMTVYLTIKTQRIEEAIKISHAVRIEMQNLAKYIVGAIDLCIKIQNRSITIPRQDATYITKNFSFEPVVYPAIADRIGLLPHPEATVGFYMRIAEAKAMLEMLSKAHEISSTTNVSAPQEPINSTNVQPVVDCLITALQLVIPIISDNLDAAHKNKIDATMREATLCQIEKSLTSARVAFPNVASFNEL